LRFGGYPLSEHEVESRKAEIRKLEAAAVRAHQEATARQVERDANSLSDQRKAWQIELRKMKLVFDLYTAGLSINSIQDLTGLNAGTWIRDGTLPVKLAYARRDLIDRNFVVPTQVDANIAYIVGALCGGSRVFSQTQGISFRNPDLTRVVDVRDRFQRVFSTSLAEVALEGRGYVVRVGRSALVRELFDRLGIVDGSTDFIPPFEIIKYSDTCRAFVQGFLTFSRSTIDVDRHLFQIVRRHQPHLLKVVGVGLYLEKVYPVVRQNEQSSSLTISAKREFDTLCAFAPGILSEEERARLTQEPKMREDPLGSYAAYQSITRVLQGAYPHGVKLNFEDILRRAGIKCEVTNDVRAKVSYWRSGRKPYVAQRAEALEQMLGTLYPESKA
jgi:hypothetical protein